MTWVQWAYVGLGRDLEVLEVLCSVSCYSITGKVKLTLSVESDVSGLHLSLLSISQGSRRVAPPLAHLDVDLVTAEDNGDVLANPLEVTVPVRDVLVGDSRGDVEHDDTALTLDVVSVTQTTELLLARRVPHVEADGTEVGVESQRVNLDTKSSCV